MLLHSSEEDGAEIEISGRTLREADRLVACRFPFLEVVDESQHLCARLDVRTSVRPCLEDVPGGFLYLIGAGDVFHANFGNLLFSMSGFNVKTSYSPAEIDEVPTSSLDPLDFPFPLPLS